MPALGWTDAMLRWRCIDRVELRSWLHEAGNGSVDGSGSGGAVAPEAAACDLLVAGLPISTAEMARGVAYVSRSGARPGGAVHGRRPAPCSSTREHAAVAQPSHPPTAPPCPPLRPCAPPRRPTPTARTRMASSYGRPPGLTRPGASWTPSAGRCGSPSWSPPSWSAASFGGSTRQLTWVPTAPMRKSGPPRRWRQARR